MMKSKYTDFKIDKEVKEREIVELHKYIKDGRDKNAKAAAEIKLYKGDIEKLNEQILQKNQIIERLKDNDSEAQVVKLNERLEKEV